MTEKMEILYVSVLLWKRWNFEAVLSVSEVISSCYNPFIY